MLQVTCDVFTHDVASGHATRTCIGCYVPNRAFKLHKACANASKARSAAERLSAWLGRKVSVDLQEKELLLLQVMASF